MTLSIRTRLTLWYSAVVVLVLVTAAVVGALAQARLGLQRLDDDLERSLATLEGVMRTEFSKGLSLEGAADEASIEVVVPGRTLVLTRDDGSLLETWGLPLETAAIVQAPLVSRFATESTSAGEVRVLRKLVTDAKQPYRAFVIASMDALDEQHAEMVRSMVAGVLIALVAAALGGWVIGRQTLRPLSQMADQASRIGAKDLEARLSAVRTDDELGLLARAFNGLLDRLATALHQQRQFMADASHELRTPVSVIRTATQVTLTKDARSVDEYRESLVIVGEQANRLSRLVDAMFLLSRAEAQSVPLRPEFLNLDDLARRDRAGAAGAGGPTRRDPDHRGRAGGRVHRRRCPAAPDGRQPAGQRDPARRPARRGRGVANARARGRRAAGHQRRSRHRQRRSSSASSSDSSASAGRTEPAWDCRSPDGSPRRMADRWCSKAAEPGCTAFAVSLPLEPVIDGSASG